MQKYNRDETSSGSDKNRIGVKLKSEIDYLIADQNTIGTARL